MLIELLTTGVAVQRDLVAAYLASGRQPEIGLYFVAVNQATVRFLSDIEAPPEAEELVAAFVEWQIASAQALIEEIATGTIEEGEDGPVMVASQRFARLFQELATGESPDPDSAAGAPGMPASAG